MYILELVVVFVCVAALMFLCFLFYRAGKGNHCD